LPAAAVRIPTPSNQGRDNDQYGKRDYRGKIRHPPVAPVFAPKTEDLRPKPKTLHPPRKAGPRHSMRRSVANPRPAGDGHQPPMAAHTPAARPAPSPAPPSATRTSPNNSSGRNRASKSRPSATSAAPPKTSAIGGRTPGSWNAAIRPTSAPCHPKPSPGRDGPIALQHRLLCRPRLARRTGLRGHAPNRPSVPLSPGASRDEKQDASTVLLASLEPEHCVASDQAAETAGATAETDRSSTTVLPPTTDEPGDRSPTAVSVPS